VKRLKIYPKSDWKIVIVGIMMRGVFRTLVSNNKTRHKIFVLIYRRTCAYPVWEASGRNPAIQEKRVGYAIMEITLHTC
jgi:hypothetical protein